MKTNAFARNARLFRVWGDDSMPPYIDLVDQPVTVIWSPTLKQWIMSITCMEWRYDAIVSSWQFVLDASLLPVNEPTQDGPSYYLNRMRASS
jgi:hypothetical protein